MYCQSTVAVELKFINISIIQHTITLFWIWQENLILLYIHDAYIYMISNMLSNPPQPASIQHIAEKIAIS